MNYKFWRNIFGGLLLTLGVFALVTPFTPGSWLIFVGAEMLGIGFLTRANVLLSYEKAKVKFNELIGKEEKGV